MNDDGRNGKGILLILLITLDILISIIKLSINVIIICIRHEVTETVTV